jgi:hypothetical protein
MAVGKRGARGKVFWLAGFALAYLFVRFVVFAPDPPPRPERFMTREWARIGLNDELEAYLDDQGITSFEGGEAAGFQLALDGLMRLDMGDLKLRARLISDALTDVSPEDCASFMVAPNAAALVSVFDSLQMDQWSVLATRAMAAEMRDDPPRWPTTGEETASELFTVLSEFLAPADYQNLVYVIEAPADFSIADQCRASRTIFGATESLPDPWGEVLARLIVEP